jgi:hypothetical protein
MSRITENTAQPTARRASSLGDLRSATRRALAKCDAANFFTRLAALVGKHESQVERRALLSEATQLARGKTAHLNSVKMLCHTTGVSPRSCGVDKALAAAARPKDTVEDGKATARQEVQDLLRHRTRTGKHYLRCFNRAYKQSVLSLRALGTLNPDQVQAALRKAGRPPAELGQLARATAKQFTMQLTEEIKDLTAKTIRSVDGLLAKPEARRRFLAAFATTQQQRLALRGLGIRPDVAKKISQSPRNADTLFRSGLQQARTDLVEARKKALHGQNDEAVAYDVVRAFDKSNSDLRSALGVTKDSFANKAISEQLERGKAQKKFTERYRTVASVVASVIGGALTGGAGLAAGAALSAATTALMEGPGTLAQGLQAQRGQLGQGLGATSDSGAKTLVKESQRAKRDLAKSVGSSVAGSVLGSGAGKAFKKGLKASRLKSLPAGKWIDVGVSGGHSAREAATSKVWR